MKLAPAFVLSALPVLYMACSPAESHERTLTHPPRIYGEYVTQLAKTVDFVERELPVSIPGRRPVYDVKPLNHNVILANRANTVEVTVINHDAGQPLAPHTVTVTFYDGPEGHPLDTQSMATGVIPPLGQETAALTTPVEPPEGIYYWSYTISRTDGWEEAVQAYEGSQESETGGTAAGEDEGDEWGEDDWE